jgi:hypothetical protein
LKRNHKPTAIVAAARHKERTLLPLSLLFGGEHYLAHAVVVVVVGFAILLGLILTTSVGAGSSKRFVRQEAVTQRGA